MKAPLVIVPAAHYDEVRRRIGVIRNMDKPKRLGYDCKKLNEELINDFGVAASEDALSVGRRYGVIGYSPSANAIRNGEVIRNHGEIYLYAWTYCEDGAFRQDDAWGGAYESLLPGCPLIEL